MNHVKAGGDAKVKQGIYSTEKFQFELFVVDLTVKWLLEFCFSVFAFQRFLYFSHQRQVDDGDLIGQQRIGQWTR